MATDLAEPAMKVRAIAPWFGGKRTMAPAIVEELGKHTQYFEPFCGSMAVLFAKPVTRYETVNDLHGDLTNLAWVLQDRGLAEALYDRAGRVLFCESLIKALWKDLAASDPGPSIDPERAYKFFVFSWAMRNGVAGTSRVRGNGFQIALRFTATGGSSTTRFRSATESIPAWHERLRNVVILRRDGFSLLPRLEDAPGLAVYADPPYIATSRSGFAASGATSRYEHEFSHESPLFGDDHERLRDELARLRRARVVVSYYDCPAVRRLYDGWTFVEHTRQKNLHVQIGRGARPKAAPEVLIINGESYA